MYCDSICKKLWEVRGADTISNDCVLIIRSLSPSSTENGYYEAVSSGLKDRYDKGYADGYAARSVNASITYTYHHHSLSTTNLATSSTGGGLYADSYQATSPMGCFTKAQSLPVTCGGSLYTDSNDKPVGGDVWVYCSVCGQVAGAQSRDWVVRNYGTASAWVAALGSCSKITSSKTVYVRSCGKVDGQIVTATITY